LEGASGKHGLDASSFITRTAAPGKSAFCLEKRHARTRAAGERLAISPGAGGFRHPSGARAGGSACAPPTCAYIGTPVVDLAVAVVVDAVTAKLAQAARDAALVRADETYVARRRTEFAFIHAADLLGLG